MTVILNGKDLAQKKRKELKVKIDSYINSYSSPPKLVAIIIGNDAASEIYVLNKAKACKNVGIESIIMRLKDNITETKLLEIIKRLNIDNTINGILVQLPLPNHINPQKIIETIDRNKDVDGFHPYNIGKLALKQPTLRPCTPYGIMQLLTEYSINTSGMNATIIGVSNIVGRPLALELLLAGATVTCCHSKTKNIKQHIETADLIISATGKQNVFSETNIPDHATVIDVGIHRIDNVLCGDLDFNLLNNRVSYLTPVPGGVGPMTITALLQNTFQAAVIQKNLQA